MPVSQTNDEKVARWLRANGAWVKNIPHTRAGILQAYAQMMRETVWEARPERVVPELLTGWTRTLSEPPEGGRPRRHRYATVDEFMGMLLLAMGVKPDVDAYTTGKLNAFSYDMIRGLP